jgi:hypothetical protein
MYNIFEMHIKKAYCNNIPCKKKYTEYTLNILNNAQIRPKQAITKRTNEYVEAIPK